MRILKTSSYGSFRNGTATDKELTREDLRSIDQFVKNLDSDVARVFDLINGQIRFGTVSNLKLGENIFGQWATVADTGTANTEFAVPHTLSAQSIGIVPANFIVTYRNKGGVVYDSGTTWTTTNIYLKCSAANAALRIFIMP